MNRPYRWVVLGVFLLAAGLSQFLWLNFAPILTQIQSRYQVSESTAGLLLLVFPLIYVLLSIPAGTLTDRRGYRFAVGLGSILMAAFSCLRIWDGSFWMLLLAQVGIAVGQPFVVNGISKLVLDWFSLEQGAIATGLGTAGMFIGMAAGMAATPPLVQAYGLRATMGIFAGISCVITALFLALCRENHPKSVHKEIGIRAALTPLLRNRVLVLVFVLAFIGLGFFNGLTTWLEPILAPQGLDSVQAGNIGGGLILGGILGAGVIPALSDLFKRRKPFLLVSIFMALATLYPLCQGRDYGWALVLGGLQGFFFLPAFALLLEICSELAGEKLAGSATGILMLFGNLGGVVVILAMEAVNGGGATFYPAVILLLVLLALALALALFLPETHRLRRLKA
ncbi:MAG: MFS transporter [Bdellovibrionota bacterium]